MSVAAHKPITAATRLCAVFGQPIRHSASPAMHNAGLAELGLDWRYLGCEVAPSELRQAIEGARAMHWVGLNLTVPHKLLAVPLMDELDESARLWGAVNTVVFDCVAEFGGSFSAEHGIGRLRRDELARSLDPARLEWMRRIKALFDPEGRLNPGRVL